MAGSSRYQDFADAIRRLIRNGAADTVPPRSFSYKLGDDVARAVPPRSAADEAAAAADDLGPEYDLDMDWGGPDARLRERVQAAEQAAADRTEAAAAQARYRDRTMPPPPSYRVPAAAAGAAATLAPAAALLLSDDETPAVTSGGTAELAAEVPALAVAPDEEVKAQPTPASKPSPPARSRPNPNIRGDAFYSQPGVFDNDRRHAELVAAGMTPEAAATKMAQDYFAAYDARAQARADAAMQRKQGPVYGPDSVVYDADGRPHLRAEQQVVLRPGQKIDPITGRATNMSDRERDDQARARFRDWVNEEPGSRRQGQYNPAGWDQWYQTIVDRQHQDYLADAEKYGSAEGKDWRERLTPEQAQARADRAADESARFQQRVAARALLKSDPRVMARQAELDRRARNRQLMTQHPFITLGDPDINEWQKFVLAQGMAPEGARVTDPNAVSATHNEQAMELAKRFSTGQGFQQLTPEQQRLLEIEVRAKEAGLPPQEQAINYRDKPEIHSSEEQMVDDYVSQRYSTPGSAVGLGGLSSSFTPSEQQKVIEWLINEKKYAPEKATALVDNIAGKRSSQSWWGNWGD
ncbi:MAG: hypothetical protein EBR82_22830 [Caulobacteraceae bacterium]|nr:hypothetical protein [Caulobacteraceae bacterium]